MRLSVESIPETVRAQISSFTEDWYANIGPDIFTILNKTATTLTTLADPILLFQFRPAGPTGELGSGVISVYRQLPQLEDRGECGGGHPEASGRANAANRGLGRMDWSEGCGQEDRAYLLYTEKE